MSRYFYDEDDIKRAMEKDGLYSGAEKWVTGSGLRYFPCTPETPSRSLPPGAYEFGFDNERGLFIMKMDTQNDDTIVLPDTVSDEVIKNVDDFWELENEFNDFGYLWKRGIMLYGPPGSGKTTTINIVVDEFVKRGGICIYATNPNLLVMGLTVVRRIEKNRPIVVILEDLDELIAKAEGEFGLTVLLDGETQIDKVVYIATTNYINKLDNRLTKRPSRFDEVVYVDMPSAEARRVYIQTVLNRRSVPSNVDVEEWVEASEGLAIAHIKEMIISVLIFKKDLNTTVEKLRQLMVEDEDDDDEDGNKDSVSSVSAEAVEIIDSVEEVLKNRKGRVTVKTRK